MSEVSGGSGGCEARGYKYKGQRPPTRFNLRLKSVKKLAVLILYEGLLLTPPTEGKYKRASPAAF